MSDLLRLLMTKEWRERFTLFHERIALLLFHSQKTSELLKTPMSEFSTLARHHLSAQPNKNALLNRSMTKFIEHLSKWVSHTSGCGIPDTTPAPEIMYQYAQVAQKRPNSHKKKIIEHLSKWVKIRKDVYSSLVAHLAAVAATRVRFPASCQIL